MRRQKSRKNKNRMKILSYALFSILLMVTFACVLQSQKVQTVANAETGTMKVHYLDVGESDSVLVESDKRYMLIDAGDTDDRNTIIQYLKNKKIKKLDYLVLTHPHADHIGSAAEIVKQFDIGKIIMSPKEHTTKTFENLLDAIEEKGYKIKKPVVGESYQLGDASFRILAPNSMKYGSNINNYSVALKVTNGSDDFLFVGDCETEALADIMKNGQNISAEVLMCGHHGSDTSTTKEFLRKVDNQYAIISVGKNNYGHPSGSTLELLNDKKIKTYRTDKAGTIIATSTGNEIVIDAKASVYKAGAASEDKNVKSESSASNKKEESKNKGSAADEKSSEYVYITKSGKKYHLSGCRYLKSSKIKITKDEAKAKKYTPCETCKAGK